MLNFGNKEFRNLQEQVEKNASDILALNYGSVVLSEFGIKVVGQIESADDLPDPTLFTEEDVGNAYAVGTEPPYTLYILTRPFVEGDPLQWFNIGQFPVPGPQGPAGQTGATGETGPRGNSCFAGSGEPPLTGSYKAGDVYIDATTGYVYTFLGTIWSFVGSIKGPQGPQGEQGIQGPQGIQGIQGPQGPKGDPGNSFNIIGQVASISNLPDPDDVPTGSAYLVGTQAPYHLYVLILEPTRSWFDTGVINDYDIVTLTGTGGTISDMGVASQIRNPSTIVKLEVDDVRNSKSYIYYKYGCTSNRPYSSSSYVIDVYYVGRKFVSSDGSIPRSAVTNNLSYIKFTAYDGGFQWSLNNQSIITDGELASYYTKNAVDALLDAKQDTLVSGTNIKTINNTSLVGSGNIDVVTDLSDYATINWVSTELLGKQDSLVSGTNIKTINNESILGTGNLSVITDISGKQDVLISGTNIKTLNNESLLGSGNISLVLPTNVSDLTNDVGYITSSALAPYALAANVPTATSDLTNDSGFITSADIPAIPTKVSDLTNDSGFITSADLSGYALSSDIPTATSDLTNDSGFITNAALSGYALTSAIPTKISDLTNDSGFITSSALSGYVLASSLAAVATSGSYADLSNKPTIPTAVSDLSNDSGFQTQSDVLGILTTGGYATETYVNNAISGLGSAFVIKGSVATVADLPASGNSIGDVYYVEARQAGYVWIEINHVEQWEQLGETIDLSNYALISDLPTATSDLTNDSGFITSSALSPYVLASSLATVATSGSYADLSNKPSIPTRTSDITNDSGFITSSALNGYALSSSIPTKVSDLTNDTGFITSSALSGYALSSAIPTKVSDLTNDSGFTTNTGTVTSVRVQAGTGLASSQNTAQSASLDTTISIASGYKLPTTAEWGAKQDASTAYNTSNIVYSASQPANPVAGMIWLKPAV